MNALVSPAIVADQGMMRRHVELLTGDARTPVHVRLIHPDKLLNREVVRLEGSIPNLAEQIDGHQRYDGLGAFVVVNEGGNTDAEITRIRAVFIDGDGIPIPDERDWHVQPDFLVVNDETHGHAYWLVDELDAADFRVVQKRLAARYGSDAVVCNPSRVMRLAGSIHNKNPRDKRVMRLVELRSGPPRSVAEITAGLPPLASPKHLVETEGTERELDEPGAIMRANSFLAHAEPLIDGQNSDERTYQYACQLRDLNISDATAIEMLSAFAPDFDEAWIASKVGNAYRYAQNRQPGVHAVAPASEVFGDAAAKLVSPPAGATADDDRWAKFSFQNPGDMALLPRAAFWDADRTLPRAPQGCRVVAAGKYSSHKTNFVLAKVLDAIQAHGAKAIYVAGEAGYDFGQSRIPAQCAVRNISPASLNDSLKICEVCPRLTDPEDVAGFIDYVKANVPWRPDFIVLDTLSEALTGQDENSAQEASIAMAQAYAIQRAFNCAVILVCHVGKDASKGARGSSVFVSGSDASWTISFETQTGIVHQWIEKVRGGRARFNVDWSTQIVLGEGDRGVMTVVPISPSDASMAAAKAAREATKADPLRCSVEQALASEGAFSLATSISLIDLATAIGNRQVSGPNDQKRTTQIGDAKRQIKNALRARNKASSTKLDGLFADVAWPQDGISTTLERRFWSDRPNTDEADDDCQPGDEGGQQ